ncbi:hypothetical protein MGWOODY_Tha1158 [hydrothermal vent metagenome]|uniref:Uncharacterized protein n=2 Tax=root TaxID=1 RepID=A0A160TDY9_9ZZZZ
MYNYLINDNLNIAYDLVNKDDIIFSGTPDEYTEFLKSN